MSWRTYSSDPSVHTCSVNFRLTQAVVSGSSMEAYREDLPSHEEFAVLCRPPLKQVPAKHLN